MAELIKVIGLEVIIDLEVPMLWAELQSYFPDKDVFIPCVVGVVKAWVECLIVRLEDDANIPWTDKLLEHLNRSEQRLLRARVEVFFSVYPLDKGRSLPFVASTS